MEPRKPSPPALAQLMAFPAVSVMVTMVLLKDELIWAAPLSIFFLSMRRRTPLLTLGFAIYLNLPLLFLFARYDLLGSFAGTRVLLGALSAHGQALAVTNTAVAAYLNKTLDIKRYLAAQIALHLEVLVYIIPEPVYFVVRQGRARAYRD